MKRTGGGATRSIEAWIASLEARPPPASSIICYNFMPVVDWSRTDLDWPLPTGATAMRFDHDRFAAFDLHILQAPGRRADYSEAATRERATRSLFEAMDAGRYRRPRHQHRQRPAGLDHRAARRSRHSATACSNIAASTPTVLRRHLSRIPRSASRRSRKRSACTLTLHPDDPPRPLFGLPRIASTAEDYQALFDAVPSKANGMCFCTGRLGVRPDNDLPAMARRFAPRIDFAHLRATKREGETRSASTSPTISTATST